ncbi:MAG: hypothetical protein ILP10_00155 [Lachnospiraceae bacterium]|nr:hypothetical protein [Lachnospiraceae bacterium]
MRKILYTLRYGDGRTKAFLIGIISSLFLAVVCGALCFILNPLIFGGAAFVLAIIAAILVVRAGFKSVDGQDEDTQALQGERAPGPEGEKPSAGRPVAAERPDPETGKAPVRPESISPGEAPKQEAEDLPANEEVTGRDLPQGREQEKTEELPDDEPPGRERPRGKLEEEPEEERPSKRRGKLEEEPEEDEEDESAVTYLKQYTPKAMTKLFKTVRVKGDPTAILIDLCEGERIRQCPAYVWQAKGQVCFLLLEKSPRTVSFAASEVLEVTNRPGVSANPKQDYQNLSDLEELREEFERLMPATFSEGMAGRYSFKKNLYVLGHDIAITPMSLRAMLPKFDFTFKLKDKLLADRSFSDYFREAYKWKILWNDGVLTVKEYQERIRHSLSLMALDKKVIDYDFEKNLSQMIHYRLITDEYADYFRARRAEKKQ